MRGLRAAAVLVVCWYFHVAQAEKSAAVWNDAMVGKIGASVMGESALIDKESGRIYWEGGSSSISNSIVPILSSNLGIRHFKSIVLSALLLLSVLSLVPRRLLFLGLVPRVDPWVIGWVVLFYLLESYTCNTRRYLTNALSSPEGVEEYIEMLREENPVVTWKMRCFHYEKRQFLTVIPRFWKSLTRSNSTDDDDDDDALNSLLLTPSVLTKKVVSARAQSNYEYKSCHDGTVAGVWKRSRATSTSPAPFSKIILTKLLVLSNRKAREDYFRQQADFVTREGQSDEYTEFSTDIHVEGFKPRMLAVRNRGHPWFRLHMFWVFTFLGLTVPFRIWFSRHCDQLRVTVTKVTSTDTGWFPSSSLSDLISPTEAFRHMMQELSLYGKKHQSTPNTPPKNETTITE